jgi:hypothetical protein
MAKAPRSSPPRSCGLNAHARPKVRFGLVRRLQPGRSPLHRIGLDDEPVDVLAVYALKRAHLESDPGGFDARQDHRTQTFGTGVRLDCDAAGVEQNCERRHDAHLRSGRSVTALSVTGGCC